MAYHEASVGTLSFFDEEGEHIGTIYSARMPECRKETLAATLDAELSAGKNVVVHCRQGIGRTGLIAACLLVSRGVSPGSAVDALSAARGIQVPETAEQRQWIDHYAAVLAHPK